jgi:Transcriptional regulators
MAVLGEYPGSSADEISKKTQTEKSIISRALQRLLKRRLVTRQVNNEDRRRQHLRLTKTGQDIYRQVVPISYDYEDRLLECFSERERASFDKLIDKLYKHADQID